MQNADGHEIVAAAPAMYARTIKGARLATAINIARAGTGRYAIQTIGRRHVAKTIAWVSPSALDVMIADLVAHRDAFKNRE